jgi:hypothetical protein
MHADNLCCHVATIAAATATILLLLQGLIGLIVPSDGTGRIDGEQLREALVPEVHRLVPLLKFLNIRLQVPLLLPALLLLLSTHSKL